jgi:hypothetical protein
MVSTVLYVSGYLVLLVLGVLVIRGFLSLWTDHMDEDEVEQFRAELDTWDSSLFLEDADVREDERS